VVCLGTAWITAQVGVSLAAGAFLAGLVVAGSDFRHQALSDLIPFRELFTSFFFISVGMLLDPALLVQSPGPILLLLAAIILGKSLLVFLVGAIMRLPLRVCVLSGVALAQVGEFAFVLAQQARPYGLLPDPLSGQLTSAFILSMFITPLLLAFAPHIAAGMGQLRILTRFWGVKTADEVPEELRQARDHVIIAGYGLAGQSLAAALENCGLPFVVVDLNPANVRLATAKGIPAFYGDVTSPEVLHKLGIEHSNEVVLTINDPVAEERAVRAVRRASGEIHLVVRTRYVADVDFLTAAGANMIIPAEREAAISIVRQVLNRHCVAEEQIAALTRSEPEAAPPK
jgi:CPA2 family monovalent cation:H+ antiporter-2